MKKFLFVFSIVSLISLSFTSLEARGGRGGGGGGGRSGGGRSAGGGGQSIQRSPSMSRTSRPSPASKPQTVSRAPVNRPSTSRTPVNRPNVSNSQINRQNVSNPASANVREQTNARSQVQQFMRDTPATKRPQTGNAGRQIVDGRYQNIGNNVRGNVTSNYPNRGNWFNNNFWDQHQYHPRYYNNNVNWWVGATALGVGAWLGWQSEPYYYTYDEFGYTSPTLYYSDTSDTQDSYAEQAQTIETATQGTSNAEWMPLGVFSVAKNSESVAPPNMFVQLAINKSGELAGTFYNTTTNQTYELEGWVDPETQRAAWKIADNDASPIIETGLYNLTQSEAPVRIYFPNATTQDGLLVRVDD